MKERPILFNADMVRAVLDGRKTQTRRIIQSPAKNMQARGHEVISHRAAGDKWYGDYVYSMRDRSGVWQDFTNDQFLAKCPFGVVDDRLWVRETWMPDAPRDGSWGDVEFYGCKGSPLSMIPERYRKPEHCIHRASWDGSEMVGWTPSIHMPRWASRITLEITGVRVERLRDLSEEDAKSEGVIPPAGGVLPGWEHRINFRDLWMSIYGADNWEANPWVWVVEFKRVEVE